MKNVLIFSSFDFCANYCLKIGSVKNCWSNCQRSKLIPFKKFMEIHLSVKSHSSMLRDLKPLIMLQQEKLLIRSRYSVVDLAGCEMENTLWQCYVMTHKQREFWVFFYFVCDEYRKKQNQQNNKSTRFKYEKRKYSILSIHRQQIVKNRNLSLEEPARNA